MVGGDDHAVGEPGGQPGRRPRTAPPISHLDGLPVLDGDDAPRRCSPGARSPSLLHARAEARGPGPVTGAVTDRLLSVEEARDARPRGDPRADRRRAGLPVRGARPDPRRGRDEPHGAAAVGQLGDGRLRDPGRATWPARPRRRPVRLEVIGEVRAGVAPEAAVERGTAIRIATGAPMPPRADAVVQVELTTPADADGAPPGDARPRRRPARCPRRCLVHEAVEPGTAIRKAGDDLDEAIAILGAGTPAVAGRRRARRRLRATRRCAVHRRPRRRRPRDGRRGPGGGTRPRAGRDPRRERPGARGARRGGRRRGRSTSGSPRTGSRTSGPASWPPGRGRGRRDRSCRAASRSGRTTSSGRPSRRSAGSSSGGSPSSRASRSPSGSSSTRDGGDADAPVRAAGQPGLELRDVRAVRPAGDPAAGRPAGRPAPSGRRTGRSSRETVTKSPGRRAFLRVVAERDADGAPVRDERGPRAGPARRWRRGRGATSCRRSPSPTRSRSSPRPSTRSPAGADGRPAGGSTATDRASRPARPIGGTRAGARWPGTPRRARAPPPDPRRPVRPAADGRRQRQAVDRAPSRRRGDRRRVSAETLSLVIDGGGPKGDVLDGGRARRRDGRQADVRADPAVPPARR